MKIEHKIPTTDENKQLPEDKEIRRLDKKTPKKIQKKYGLAAILLLATAVFAGYKTIFSGENPQIPSSIPSTQPSMSALNPRITYCSSFEHEHPFISPLESSEWIFPDLTLPEELQDERYTVIFDENIDCEGIDPPDVDAPPSEIKGGSYTDCRSLGRTLEDRVTAIQNELSGAANRIPSVIKGLLGTQSIHYVDPSHPPKWKDDSHGLYVLVHGLKGSPTIWDPYGEALGEMHPGADSAIVLVPKGGNCGVKEAAVPILNMVKGYIKSHPGLPVSLIGTSNGGRIVAWIESELRTAAPDTPVHLSTIAGAHFGSRTMNLVNEYGIYTLLGYTPEIIEELSYGSDVAHEVLDLQRLPLSLETKRDFLYYMTTEETHVWPPTSELPIIGQGERHYVVHGEGHSSIAKRVKSHLLEQVVLWMKKEGPENEISQQEQS